MFERGAIVTVKNDIGVVVSAGADLPGDMDDHTGVWFGKIVDGIPEVWTVPTEFLSQGPQPVLKH